jgi:rhodanese-related sulfurtransferase
MLSMNRREFQIAGASTLLSLAFHLHGEDADPWPKGDLMEPSNLAALLNSSATRPAIICVAFPVLYRQKHIIHAEFAGPGSKPEGLEELKVAASKLDRNSEIVLYCGCCPMVRCPNVKPAYRQLKNAGFKKVRVLNIPENFHADWVAKGYPVEEHLGVPVSSPK